MFFMVSVSSSTSSWDETSSTASRLLLKSSSSSCTCCASSTHPNFMASLVLFRGPAGRGAGGATPRLLVRKGFVDRMHSPASAAGGDGAFAKKLPGGPPAGGEEL